MKKNIAIIGANRGIGLALCKLYGKEHFVHAFCRKSNEKLDALTGDTSLKVYENCDVTQFSELPNSARSLEDASIDIFIHVAGVWSDESFPFDSKEDVKSLRFQFETNTIAPLVSVGAFVDKLKPESQIGLITSRMGSIEDNSSGGRYGYRMSKAALNAGGKSLALDLKESGKSVYLIHPGFVQTDMTNGNGHLSADESAQGIAKLFENNGIQESGKFFHVNGEELPW